MSATLSLDYLPFEQLIGQSAAWWRSVLGVVGFERAPHIDREQIPVTASMTPLLGSQEPLCEVWRIAADAPVTLNDTAVQDGRIHYRYSDQLLFGCVRIEEQNLIRGNQDTAATVLRRATEAAYREIFAVINATGHLHLIRIWNYLPYINAHSDGDERYRHFNSARQAAFAQCGRVATATVPAASALGSRAGSPLSIYFIAARRTPVMIENPRQVSAYRYPEQYGAHRPLFSRACVMNARGGTNLFVSGTASIVGHETIHHGDVAAQTRETLTNISALLEEANRKARPSRYTLDSLKYKVYVRDPADLPAIAAELSAVLDADTPVVYLQADVCREELLVEIEASGESADEHHAGI